MDRLVGDPVVRKVIAAAEQARHDVAAEDDPDRRRALIERHRDKWVAFRPHFERVFGEKCWYTECRNPGTDDDVDHFRPKGRVAEDGSHGGYWWEALRWRNFRLSCHMANRLRINPDTGSTQGKGDHFPLVDATQRWRDPGQPNHERPALLDPVKPGDPGLLTFDIDGRVALSPRHWDEPEARRRVEVSRACLHLDWPAIRRERQLLYAKVAERVDEGEMAADALARGEVSATDWLDRVAAALIELTDDKQPYSRAAQAYVRCFRYLEWVDARVMPHVTPTEPAGQGAA